MPRRPSPRRPRYYAPPDAVAHPSPSWPWGSIVNMAAIPIITAGVVFVSQWAVTGDTLKRHDATLEQDKKEREKLRENFLSSQNRLVEVLGKLDGRMSVNEKQTEAVTRQIDRLSDIILRMSPAPAERGKR